MNDEAARRNLATAPVGTLATINPDGTPHLVPFVFALAGDLLVSAVDHKPKKSRQLVRLTNIGGDPRVALLVHHYDDDWDQLWWCRAEGTASITTDPTPTLRAALIDKYTHYSAKPPEGPWIVIRIERLRSWSAS